MEFMLKDSKVAQVDIRNKTDEHLRPMNSEHRVRTKLINKEKSSR